MRGHAGAVLQAWLGDSAVDRQRRAELVVNMSSREQLYTQADNAAIEGGRSLLERCLARDPTEAKRLAHAKTVEQALAFYEKDTKHLVGVATASLAGCTPEEVVAYLMDFNSRFAKSRRDPKFDIRCDVVETTNEHRAVIYNEFTTAPGFKNRTILNVMVWKKVQAEPLTFFWVAAPLDHHDSVPRSDERHAVRAEVMRVCRLTLLSPSKTRLEYACWLDLKGDFPRVATDTIAIPQQLHLPLTLQVYFLQVRPPSEFAADDGPILAHVLADMVEAAASKPDRAVAISTFVIRTAVLRDCEFASLDAMLISIFTAETLSQVDDAPLLEDAPSSSVSSAQSLASISRGCAQGDAAAIGRLFRSVLGQSRVVDSVVPKITRAYPALRLAEERHGWFRPMLEIIAARLEPSAMHVRPWLADVRHDRATRKAMIARMVVDGYVYSEEEESMIKRALAMLADSAHPGKVRPFKHGLTVDKSWSMLEKETGLLAGHSELVIRGAGPLDIIAYLMDLDGRHWRSQWDPEVDVRSEIREVRSPHCTIAFYECKTAPFRNRTFLSALMWQRLSDTQCVWCVFPVAAHPSVTPSDESHAVRAEAARCIRLTVVSPNVTNVEYACTLDLKGIFPNWLTNEVVLPPLLRLPYTLQVYFAQIQPVDNMKPEDGAFVGQMLVDVVEVTKKSDRASAIRTFAMRSSMLRECGFANLDAMLIGTLATASLNVRPKDVSTLDPTALTAAEAETIGRGLECMLRLSATHIEAVDELLLKYTALGVPTEQHAWFRPMLETIAKRQMARAPLGLKLRLGIGAGFSMMDMASDLYSIVNMLQSGHTMSAYGMIGLISASLAVQLLVAVMQNKHRGLRAVLWETFLVLSLVKPGVDALRVASGTERIAGAPIDPFTEMIIGKGIEIALEAAPGAALQAAIVLGGSWSTAAVVSVGISCLSTGFTTSLMAFDYDTNPAKRKTNPKFYGFTPNRGSMRVLVFAELFTLHSAHATLKAVTVALLVRTNWRWLVAYMAADHSVLIIYKIARGDLIYWVPGTFVAQNTATAHVTLAMEHMLRARRSRDCAVLADSGSREGDPR
jgi:hypothetical protein